jgi:hypothetical protein
MDFSNRSVQPRDTAPATQPVPTAAGGVASHHEKRSRSSERSGWGRFGVVAATLAVVILLIGLIVLTASGNGIKKEDSYVDTSKLQAVFLNTGQVYFGNIKALNPQYVVLTNIYYLQTSGGSSSTSTSSSTSANTSVSLVKLGCELHQPYDQMVINRAQVTFWENLQDTGQVAKAVATFQKENPNGQKCSDQSSSSGSTTNNVQSAPASSSTSTNP